MQSRAAAHKHWGETAEATTASSECAAGRTEVKRVPTTRPAFTVHLFGNAALKIIHPPAKPTFSSMNAGPQYQAFVPPRNAVDRQLRQLAHLARLESVRLGAEEVVRREARKVL
ncbi:unnamed protein product [Zymoseptoria tritici ST99CH_3D1]|nr:unnamed protein product [Zymoseptoria tritici ST99CH_3D1]